MSSPELSLLAANVRIGWLQTRAQWPPTVWLLGYVVPELLRMLVFILIGAIAGGVEGMRFALVGAIVLSIATTGVSHVTDIPVGDVQSGTYRAVLNGSLPPFLQFLARAVTLWAMGLFVAVVATVTLTLVTGNQDLAIPLLSRVWILVPAVISATMLGLLIVSPAVGSGWEMLAYNGAFAVLAVFSGAIFASASPVVAALGQVLPLTHTVSALRLSLAGEPWLAELGLELVVGLGWGVLALLAYRLQAIRGRRTGRGAFAA